MAVAHLYRDDSRFAFIEVNVGVFQYRYITTSRAYLLTAEQYAMLRDQDFVTDFYGWAVLRPKFTLPDMSPFGNDPDCPVFGYLDK